eukprot:510588_1
MSTNTETLTFSNFIEKYKLQQIESQLIKEEITINFLLNLSSIELNTITQSLKINQIQQLKFKKAVSTMQQINNQSNTSLNHSNINQITTTNNNNKRKNHSPNTHINKPNTKKRKIDISNPSNQNQCSICGSKMSSFLIDNHERHCSNNYNKNTNENNTENNNEDMNDLNESLSPVPTSINPVLIECKYCEYACDVKSLNDHELFCGSRTQLCIKCEERDTFKNLMNNKHICNINNTNRNVNTNNTNQNANENVNISHYSDINTNAFVSKLERQMYNLRNILHDRFVRDYKDVSSNFEQYDAFGIQKMKYSKKKNEFISNIRSYNSSNDNCNESRSKYEINGNEYGKSKDELRKEYSEKYKKILNLLIKILENIRNEPTETRYRKLKCNNNKLKEMIFSYSPCCEFLLLCNFEYIHDSYYEMSDINMNKIQIGLNVLNKVENVFDNMFKKENKEQQKWESIQAIEQNKNSPFVGSWSCKGCNHLNKKTALKCSQCKKRKVKIKKNVKTKPLVNLSVEKWICQCGNRNSMQYIFCENCETSKFKQ